MYAEVILPLPLYGTFTYLVPGGMEQSLHPGQRVLVQFGRSKIYTGIIASLHGVKPAEFDPKPLLTLLDATPVLRGPQLKLWQWISDYYLCAPGEVMRAALPTALKLESETWIEISPDAETADVEELVEKQASIYAIVSHEKRMRISRLEQLVKSGGVRQAVNSLIERGLLTVSEKVNEKYVSRKATYVKLACERGDKEALHGFFDKVIRSQKQENLLVAYVDASGWLNASGPIKPVERRHLMERTGTTPSVFKALVDKGIFLTETKSVNRFSPALPVDSAIVLPKLSEAQALALRDMRRQMASHLVTLLRGVTGSGKTELYTHLAAQALEHGDSVLMLVPEISLTTQLTERLRKNFGEKLLVYHSKFSDSERVDIWKRLLSTREPTLVLGVRSSVLLPFARLGLIIVDEEHEASYKQQDPAPRYNARDTAIMLATMHGAKVVLGSATPAVETYYKAKQDKYGLVELTQRYGGVQLPSVEVVDMCAQRKEKQAHGTFSAPLLSLIEKGAREKTQSILFQNRRGFAPIVVCGACGWTPKCRDCDVTLVLHKQAGQLRCHYCGYSIPVPAVCPACGENAVATYGYGTERIADEIHDLYPSLRISRMDLDTTRNKDGHQSIINEFASGATDVLVGTQMVSKGLDFKNVKLVGILSADSMLHYPDFRSDERAFNMMEQVSGRAGRHGSPGTVVIQTTKPEHPVIRKVIEHDYTGFYETELARRRDCIYPPFARIIGIWLRHSDWRMLSNLAGEYGRELRRVFGARVLGPEAPPVSRVGGLHILTFMLKIEAGASMPKVKALLRQVWERIAPMSGSKTLRLHYDVDPV